MWEVPRIDTNSLDTILTLLISPIGSSLWPFLPLECKNFIGTLQIQSDNSCRMPIKTNTLLSISAEEAQKTKSYKMSVAMIGKITKLLLLIFSSGFVTKQRRFWPRTQTEWQFFTAIMEKEGLGLSFALSFFSLAFLRQLQMS